MGLRTNGHKAGQHLVGGETIGDRPASRARRAASGGVHSADQTFDVVKGLISDVLDGSVSASDCNAVCRAVGSGIQVAHNADALDEMHSRLSGVPGQAQAQSAPCEKERARLERIACLKAELDALEG